MLNNILSKYTNKKSNLNTSNNQNIPDLYDDSKNFEAENAELNPSLSKNKKTYNFENSEDFLNENENLSMKNKCEEVLKKYCSLYADEDENLNSNFSNNNINKNQFVDKFSIKPLNHRFQEQKKHRTDNLNTTGAGWFNMKAPIMTPELREDLKTIQLRHIIDPARFYKKMDSDKLPKFFQVGRILDNILDGKRNRLKKSEVKGRIAEEFLEVDKERNYSLRKFEELQGKSRKLGLKKSKLNKYKMKSKGKARKSQYIAK